MTKRILQLLGAGLVFWFLLTAGTALEKVILLKERIEMGGRP